MRIKYMHTDRKTNELKTGINNTTLEADFLDDLGILMNEREE